MTTIVSPVAGRAAHPIDVHVAPAYDHRNRLTTAFRPLLALPHLLWVGAPVALAFTWARTPDGHLHYDWAGGGALGTVAVLCAIMAWFALLFTGEYPRGLRKLAVFYLAWRVRAIAYLTLLRDEYPPFGDGAYPATLERHEPVGARDRTSVAFRIVLAIPQLVALWALGLAWAITTLVAWFAILFTGRYPEALYHFAVGALRWNIRVDAYLLLLHDDYPPFSLH